MTPKPFQVFNEEKFNQLHILVLKLAKDNSKYYWKVPTIATRLGLSPVQVHGLVLDLIDSGLLIGKTREHKLDSLYTLNDSSEPNKEHIENIVDRQTSFWLETHVF